MPEFVVFFAGELRRQINRVGSRRFYLLATLCFATIWTLPVFGAGKRPAMDVAAVQGVFQQDETVASTQANIPAEPIQVAALSADVTQGFNLAFLQGIPAATDIRSLLGGTGATAGVQRTDLSVNQLLAGRRDILFSSNPATGDIEPCFTLDILTQIGVDLSKLPSKLQAGTDCLRLPEIMPQATITYDANQLRLVIYIPQIYMAPARRGYIDPTLWDVGTTAALLNYSLNARKDAGSTYGRSHHNVNIGLQMGANLGSWRLRNNSYINSGSNQSTTFTRQNTYLQRDVQSLKSRLTLGESYVYSPIFSSVRFLGAQLMSDDAMRPDDERGYAPVIRGNAESNATVEIRQNNFLIYTANVAAGPFEITDLAPSGSNGDLEITIIEADGSRRVLRQAFSSPPLMVRENQLKYDVAMGQVRLNDQQRNKPSFFSGTALYGLTANTTIATGLQATNSGYQSYAVGMGLNTRLGAISVDVMRSSSTVNQQPTSGERMTVRYAKFVERTNSNVSLNFHQALSEGFRSLSDHVQAGDPYSRTHYYSYNSASTKQRLDAYLSQPVGTGSLFLSGSYDKAWDSSASRSLSVGYSNQIGSAAYNISYMHSSNLPHRGEGKRRDQALMLTLSIPLGKEPRSPYGYTSLTRQNGATSAQAGVSGLLPTERDISYGVFANRNTDSTTSSAFSIGTTTSFANLNASYTHGKAMRSGSLSASGSIVAHPGGVNLGQSLSETFVLAKVEPPISGLGIATYSGVTTGYNGYAVIPSATPYRSNWVGINARGADADVDFENTMQQVVPTRGAVVVTTFTADVGQRVQFQFRLADGQFLPFGAIVSDVSGERVGLTDPRGRVLTIVPMDQNSGSLIAHWGDKTCSAAYTLAPKGKGENYRRLVLDCIDPAGQTTPPRKPSAPYLSAMS